MDGCRRFIDRLIPADDFPSASQAGLADDLARDAVGFQEPVWTALLVPCFAALAQEIGRRGHGSFGDLDPDAQDVVIADLLAGDTNEQWPVDPAEFVTTLTRLMVESITAPETLPVGRWSGTARGAAQFGSDPGARRGASAVDHQGER